jgi:acyl-CoA thioesterase-2
VGSVSTPSQPDALTELLDTLNLSHTGARTSEDIFTGHSQQTPHGRVFGGQVLAQCLVAAQRTVDAARIIHSMHGYFLRPGKLRAPITFAVDRIHDGRSFATRRTQAFQDGQPIFSMIASFQVEEGGREHQAAAPDVPAPEQLLTQTAFVTGVNHESGEELLFESSFDVRFVPGPLELEVDGHTVPHDAVWMRTLRTLPDDPDLHRATLAYASDFILMRSVLNQHGLSWAAHPHMKAASLDHAMWWHRFGRADEWLLFVQRSPSSSGARGLALGRIYDREGHLLVSTAQEGMLRVPTA